MPGARCTATYRWRLPGRRIWGGTEYLYNDFPAFSDSLAPERKILKGT
jgi:hypothetical protein